MANASTVQWVFEFLTLAVIFGIFKLFFWDLLFKEHWDNFKKETHDIANSLREQHKDDADD